MWHVVFSFLIKIQGNLITLIFTAINEKFSYIPAGTCFRVIEKKSITNDPIKKIKMRIQCLGQPSKYLSIV